MNSIDNKTLIHIGAEFVIIGGVTFWLNKRIGDLQTHVLELRKEVETYKNIISQQSQLLSRHEEILRHFFGEKQRIDEPIQKKSEKRYEQQSKIEEEEIPLEEIDKILENEIYSITEKRTKKENLDCEGDICKLKDDLTIDKDE